VQQLIKYNNGKASLCGTSGMLVPCSGAKWAVNQIRDKCVHKEMGRVGGNRSRMLHPAGGSISQLRLKAISYRSAD